MAFRALFAVAILVGCGGDEHEPQVDCADPYGGYLNGSITAPTGEVIELGAVEGTPRVTHVHASTDMPELTSFHVESSGVSFIASVSGPVTMAASFGSAGSIRGVATAKIIESCEPLVPGDFSHATGTVTMTFNGSSIEGWWNGTFENR